MEKLDISSSQTTAAQQKAAESSVSDSKPKTDFAELLKQRDNSQQMQAAQNAAKTFGQNASDAQMRNAQGQQMAALSTGNQPQMQARASRASQPMVQNPHLAKIQQASKQFDQELARVKGSTQQTQQTLGEIRNEAKASDVSLVSDRSMHAAKKQEHAEVEHLHRVSEEAGTRVKQEAQQLSQRAMNAAVADRKVDQTGMNQGVQGVAGQASAENVKGVKKPREIPQEIIDKLVEEVRVGVNELGQSEFQIDLKDGVLKGMQMRVTAEGGKVVCNFFGGNGMSKNLIESSQGSLARALEAKGLALEALNVTTA